MNWLNQIKFCDQRIKFCFAMKPTPKYWMAWKQANWKGSPVAHKLRPRNQKTCFFFFSFFY